MTRVELERALEARCVAKIEAAGGLALKLSIPGVRGFPDRTILLPGETPADLSPMRPNEWKPVPKLSVGRVWFAEFKRLNTGRISAQQTRWASVLRGMGFGVYMIDTDAQFAAAMEKEMGR